MPLNKLENFISNVEGRILYVNPNDLDATDSITNQGNSLTKPFKTVQRALLEAARFSYLRGNDNDITEKTTILLFPGEHVIDNRPGYAIKNVGGTAFAVSPTGSQTAAIDELSLTLTSNFDLTEIENILYKFNSINGGVVVPRGTSIVGLDLRKTKIRPKYVPNPTDPAVPTTAIFRITGACYFWQFSLFDGNENSLVYVKHNNFSLDNQAKPTFSHHKVTCFEYCDGVNKPVGYDLTDLDMYYSKVSNAFNTASGRDIDQKFPDAPLGFAKQRPEWEIVGAFATDPVSISKIISGDGFTPGPIITVTTSTPHGLSAGTPIKINKVDVQDYNVSTKVQNVLSATQFTYLIPFVRDNLPASPSAGAAEVKIETDTVSGASPYVFNISLRSVWGMNGMHSDGSKASGFRSMVVAQFTAVSLQKDDRAFVKYNPSSRLYEGITVPVTYGTELSTGSSSTDPATAYHLDSGAVYRKGWEITHIKISNDAFIQIVSVFAIGFTKHFEGLSGADASITNSNSNFGQSSLAATGYKAVAFAKDNHAYVTSIITPRSNDNTLNDFDWISLDVGLTTSVGISSHLYLFGYKNQSDVPPVILQGYRIGAKKNDALYVSVGTDIKSAPIYMTNNTITNSVISILGTDSSEKVYNVTSGPTNDILTLDTNHNLQNAEKIRLISETGDYPENITPHKTYYAIIGGTLSANQIKIASSFTNAQNDTALTIYGGTQLRVLSRVSDKNAGDLGSPLQWDPNNSNWFVHVAHNNDIYNSFNTLGIQNLTARSNVTFIKRFDDSRGLNEKVYKLRVVIPKEIPNAKNPEEGFVIQESSTTGARSTSDFTITTINEQDYEYQRNPRFISSCTHNSGTNVVTVYTDKPHNLQPNNNIVIRNITSTTNPDGTDNLGYNGLFSVNSIVDNLTFTYTAIDLVNIVHTPGTFTNDTNSRTPFLPRFEKIDTNSNYYIYKNDIILPYIYQVQDGIYHLYVLNAGNTVPTEFTNYAYTQNIVDFYPQLDKDNVDDNPPAAKTFALRSPLGDVATSDLKKSIVRETIDKFLKDFGVGMPITGVSTSFSTPTTGTATLTFDRPHNLSGIVTFSALAQGINYTNGSYSNVRLLDFGTTNWRGALANVVVSSGRVTNVSITHGGSGYNNTDRLIFDSGKIGSGTGAGVTVLTSGISTSVGNALQITGIGTTAGGVYRITSIPASNQVSIAITDKDSRIVVGQYAVNAAPGIIVNSSVFDSISGITTFNTGIAHGLVAGNRIAVLNSTNANVGDYAVNQIISPTSFNAVTGASLSPRYVLKYALTANSGQSDNSGENLGSRGSYIYDNEILILSEPSGVTTQTSFIVSTVNSGIATTRRFPLGSYIQINSEIMRITNSALTGAGSNKINVIRGAFGTVKENHASGTLIKKIKPLAVEFRRPTILRASSHTFEYLGYGPGNYSTGLPQVQVKTLTEREEFLSQSQEKSCGSVVYTGMNSKGDVFAGNTKTSSSSGQVTSYDIPTPTVTGQDPSRLSVNFDEITVKERILVEGGNSGTLLSQFDGPVTFNRDVKINSSTIINADLKITGVVNHTNSTQSNSPITGAFIEAGGVGIGKNLNVGGNLAVTGVTTVTNRTTLLSSATFAGITSVTNTTESTSKDDGAFIVEGGVGIEKRLNVGGDALFSNAARVNTDLTVLNTLYLMNPAAVEGTPSGVGQGDIISNGGSEGAFSLFNPTYGGRIRLFCTNSAGSANRIMDATSNNITIGTNSNTDSLTIVGTTSLQGPVSINQNQYMRVGNAYFSSGGNYTHIANNEWYNGSSWVGGGVAGCLYQQSAQNHQWYKHDGSGNHNTLMTLDASAYLTLEGGSRIKGELRVDGDITAFFSSDQRLKDNIAPIPNALDKVISISGNNYTWNKESGKEGNDVGVIAQEVLEVLPEAVTIRDNGYMAVDYQKLVPLLIEAIKDLSAKVESLEEKLNNK